jgi:hypothetical protein
MLWFIVLALTAGDEPPRRSIPDTTPIYCYPSANTYDPVVDTDFGKLRAAVLARFDLRPQLTAGSDTTGRLRQTKCTSR